MDRPAALRPGGAAAGRPPRRRGGDPRAARRRARRGQDPARPAGAIDETFGPGAIRREAGSRRIAVEASVEGRDLGGAADDVRGRLAAELPLPTGYFVDVGGRVESQERATRALLVASLVAIVAVFVLLYLALGCVAESAGHPGDAAGRVRRRHPGAADRRRDLERVVARRPDRPVRHRRPERPGARRADPRRSSRRAGRSRRRCARRASAACGRS